MIKTIILLVTITGMSTVYGSAEHYDKPLYCDAWENDLRFDLKSNFVAVPVSWYESGDYVCGDEIILTFPDGTRMRTYALDAGPLESFSVLVNGQYIPIVVDIPDYLAPFKGLSSQVEMVNVSLANRMLPQSESFGYLVR